MRKILAAILAIMLLAMSALPCFAAAAEEPAVSPRYTYIAKNYVDLMINETTGIAECVASCYTAESYTVEVQCKLQRYENHFWVTEKSWTSFGHQYASICRDWAVYSGYTYRVYATFNIRDSADNILESETSSVSYYYP